MKNIYKFLLSILLVVCVIHPMSVKAINIYITPDKYEAEVGEVITYTVTVDGGEAVVNVDGQDVEFNDESNEKSFDRSYSNPGEYTFAVRYNQEMVDFVVVNIVEEGSTDQDETTPDDNNQVETTDDENQDEEETKSDDARLSSITVKDTDGDNIAISFESSKTEYEIDLTSEQTQITINAVAWDEENAKVEGDGLKAISVGKNTFEIIVTAEDGTTKQTYTIVVNVEAVPVTYLSYNGKDYGLMKELKNVNGPEGFKKTSATINKENVPVFKKDNITLIYGLDDEDNGKFFIYREDDGIVGMYNPLTIGKTTIYLIDVPLSLQTREAMTFENITIVGKEVPAWVFDDQKLVDYALIYALNGSGIEDYYIYDGKTQQLIEYSENEPTTYAEFEQWLNAEEKAKPNYVLYGSIAAVIFAVIGVGVWLFIQNKKVDDEEEMLEEEIKPVIKSKKIKLDNTEYRSNKETKKPVIDNEDEDDWLTEDFYKTIIGDDK